MSGSWMHMPDSKFSMASLSLFSPLLPLKRTVSHHTLRLMRGMSGQAQVRFGERVEPLPSGQMMLINEDVEYEVEATDGKAMLCELDIAVLKSTHGFCLPQALYRGDTDYADLCVQSAPVTPFQDVTGLSLSLINFLQLCSASRGNDTLEALIELTLAVLLMAVGDALYDAGKASAVHGRHVENAIQYIRSHYMFNITAEDIAENAHLHQNYLHRLFAAEMGCSLGEYVTAWRMEKARALLIGSGLNVAQIARLCGIPNHQHFTKTFKKSFALSPIEFRRRFDITCSYAEARAQYGVTHYAAPALNEEAAAKNLTFFNEAHKQSDFMPVVKAYYNRANMLESTKDTTDHAHSLYEIMYVQEGMITVETEDSVIPVGRRQFIWLDASVHHKLILNSDLPSGVVNIEFAFQQSPSPVPSTRQLYEADDAYRAMLDTPAPYLLITDTQDMMGTLLREIVLLANSTHRKKDELTTALIQQCLLVMASQRRVGEQDGLLKKSSDPRLARMAAQMEDMYQQPLTADQLAASTGMTTAHLKQLLRQETGLTANEYIQRVRIEKSKPLLAAGHTALETALLVGFSSQQYFSLLFKRFVGMTPKAYAAKTSLRRSR